MKKLTIVGRGTVGCLAVVHFLKYTDWKIDWIFDENIPTSSVGEATNLKVPINLKWALKFDFNNVSEMGGSVKLGISKKGWTKKKFIHAFPIGLAAIHFSAKDFQNLIYKRVKNNPRLKIINGHVNDPETLDSDFVMMCAGSPNKINEKEFQILKNIPTNSAYVVQCDWEYPKFNYSLTDAMPNGWVFGIPLQNRISIGYIYNDQLVSLDKVKEDIENIFKHYNITPSNRTQNLKFKSYYRKNNFTAKVIYNGNASFFLEPLEATSTDLATDIIRLAFDLWHNELTVEQCQQEYEKKIDHIESMILLHYMTGSIFKSDFWKNAKNMAISKIKKEFEDKTEWSRFVLDAIYNKESNIEIGTWNYISYRMNIKGLNLEKNIINLKKKYD